MISGAERLILKLAGSLINKGHQISIICHQFHPSCARILPQGAVLYRSGSRIDFFKNRYLNAAFDYARNGKLMRLIPESADLICCFGPAITLSSRIKRETKRPLLYFCYEPPRFLYTDHEIIRERLGFAFYFAEPWIRFYKNQDRRQIQQADRVLCNSEFGKTLIQNLYGIRADVITHGLDPYVPSTNVGETRKKMGLKADEVGVITVNYLHPRKRLDLFIAAVRKARKTFPKLRGVIIGDGPERNMLERLGGNEVRFTGFVPEEELADYYQAADIYLHTGRMETFGLSVIEASGNRLPIVSVAEGGPLETVIDQETGYLVESSPAELAQALLRLASDAELRKKLGENGFRYVRGKFSWTQAAEDFLSSTSKVNEAGVMLL
jgi:glycosyltransferase involved in cell wall biosynthesis